MEGSKQKCLEYVCKKEGHGFGGVFKRDAAEDQFFAYRRDQDGVNGQKRRDIIKANAFHDALVGLKPSRADSGDEHYHIGGYVLHPNR